LGAAEPRTVKLDIAADEYVETVQQATVFTGLWDDLPEPLAFDVYGIDEIGAEKLRCVIQQVQCRDPYDLYRLVDSLRLSLVDIRPLFERKTRAKGLDPAIFSPRFEERQAQYKKRWDDEMGAHLADPPTFNDTLRLLRRHLRAADLLD